MYYYYFNNSFLSLIEFSFILLFSLLLCHIVLSLISLSGFLQPNSVRSVMYKYLEKENEISFDKIFNQILGNLSLLFSLFVSFVCVEGYSVWEILYTIALTVAGGTISDNQWIPEIQLMRIAFVQSAKLYTHSNVTATFCLHTIYGTFPFAFDFNRFVHVIDACFRLLIVQGLLRERIGGTGSTSKILRRGISITLLRYSLCAFVDTSGVGLTIRP